MGQAKRRGTKEERIAQAQKRKRDEQQTVAKPVVSFPKSQQEIEAIEGVLFSNLTTPLLVDEQVASFCRRLSGKEPVFMNCQPEMWSRQSCCEENVKHYIEMYGGSMVCGYRIWYNKPIYIEGERHVIWTNGIEWRDVSFVDTGETKILFVPDDLMFDDAPAKVRHSFDASYKLIVDVLDHGDRVVTRLTPEEAWNSMPTYEEWLAGRRAPNMWLEKR